MSDIGLVQGAYYSHFSQPLENLSQFSLSNPYWFVNSGATNHITSSLNYLSLHVSYNSGDKVFVGNGQQLSISSVGLGQLHTQT